MRHFLYELYRNLKSVTETAWKMWAISENADVISVSYQNGAYTIVFHNISNRIKGTSACNGLKTAYSHLIEINETCCECDPNSSKTITAQGTVRDPHNCMGIILNAARIIHASKTGVSFGDTRLPPGSESVYANLNNPANREVFGWAFTKRVDIKPAMENERQVIRLKPLSLKRVSISRPKVA